MHTQVCAYSWGWGKENLYHSPLAYSEVLPKQKVKARLSSATGRVRSMFLPSTCPPRVDDKQRTSKEKMLANHWQVTELHKPRGDPWKDRLKIK